MPDDEADDTLWWRSLDDPIEVLTEERRGPVVLRSGTGWRSGCGIVSDCCLVPLRRRPPRNPFFLSTRLALELAADDELPNRPKRWPVDDRDPARSGTVDVGLISFVSLRPPRTDRALPDVGVAIPGSRRRLLVELAREGAPDARPNSPSTDCGVLCRFRRRGRLGMDGKCDGCFFLTDPEREPCPSSGAASPGDSDGVVVRAGEGGSGPGPSS
jgi:hypothetical protein